MTRNGYDHDLAYVHDVGFGEFSRRAAPGLVGMLRAGRIRRGLVVDLGCGSGIWAQELIAAGYDVLGVDLSAAMVERARQRVPQARFVNGSFLCVRLPRCEAVTSIGECLAYLFDRKNSEQQLARLFARVHAALRPGGLFIFDVCEPGQVSGKGPRLGHWQGRDWAILMRVAEDRQRQRLSRHITTFRRVGKLFRRSEETHRLLLYRAPDLARALRRAGFRVRFLRRYGSLPLLTKRIGFLARKPKTPR